MINRNSFLWSIGPALGYWNFMIFIISSIFSEHFDKFYPFLHVTRYTLSDLNIEGWLIHYVLGDLGAYNNSELFWWPLWHISNFQGV